MKKTILLIATCVVIEALNSVFAQVSCDETLTIDKVLALEPKGYDQWSEKNENYRIHDEAIIVFSDGVKGILYRDFRDTDPYWFKDKKGTSIGRYSTLRFAIRALYVYQKCGLIINDD